MANELYRDYIDGKADEIINSLGGTITPAPANAELYRDFLDRKFDDVINAIDNVKVKSITYTGNGNSVNTIVFSDTPKFIMPMSKKAFFANANHYMYLSGFSFGDPMSASFEWADNTALTQVLYTRVALLTYNGNEVTITTENAQRSMNITGVDYTLYYI